jgi:hypothetical protein
MSQKLLLYLTFVIFVPGLALTDTTIAQPANLYARWPLNEGEGEIVFDISGNNLHGVIQNADNGLGPDGSVWVEDPVRGTVISFNGTAEGAYVRAGEIPQMTLTNDFTWSFWAKHSEENTADNDIILGNRMDENAVDFVPRQFIKFTPTKFEWHMNGNGNDNLEYDDIPADIWFHHAVVKAGDQLTYYRNGVESGSGTFTQPLDVPQPLFFGGDNEGAAGENWSGLMSEVQLYTRALTADEVLQVMALPVGTVIRTSAYGEIPSNKAIDVSIDTDLSWAQGDYSDTHDVYFSTVFEDVNDADRTNPLGALLSQDQDSNMYDLDRLDYGQTYYWRVDDVNEALTGSTVLKGKIWQFMTELFYYVIPGDRITATASSKSEESGGPEKTIDGSGLTSVMHPIDTRDDTHSTKISDMWVSSKTDMAPWIQYNFDKPYKLDSMLVWNFNGILIWNMLGLKTVNIEYSTNGGTTWQSLSNVPDFAKATGTNGYNANTIVPFGNLVVNAVKLTAASNWSGGISSRCGLSEINFLTIPTYASAPNPQNGATNVPVDTTLYWKAGREAAQHKVYLSTDEAAVASGTATAMTVSQVGYKLNSQEIAMGSTYYWRIDEVNDAETISTYNGDTWSFKTQDYIVVDDFERYVNTHDYIDPLQVYNNWTDGLENPSKNGSIFSSTVNAADVSINPMETFGIHDDTKVVLLYYNNTTPPMSEVKVNTALLPIGSNWTKGNAKTLVIWFYGYPSNNITDDQMYVKVNNSKVIYGSRDSDVIDNIAISRWTQWNIDLTSFDTNLSNVENLTIGFERIGATGGEGVILLDDIYLVRLSQE